MSTQRITLLIVLNIKVRIYLTGIALTLIINDILVSLDKPPMLYLATILACALYTRDHHILSIRLNKIGIHGQMHSWFMYFVSTRISSVKINSS